MANNGMSGNQQTIIWIVAILALVGIVVFTVNSCHQNSEATLLSNLLKMIFPK